MQKKLKIEGPPISPPPPTSNLNYDWSLTRARKGIKFGGTERLSFNRSPAPGFKYSANGKHQIQVKNFLKIENEAVGRNNEK